MSSTQNDIYFTQITAVKPIIVQPPYTQSVSRSGERAGGRSQAARLTSSTNIFVTQGDGSLSLLQSQQGLKVLCRWQMTHGTVSLLGS